MLVWLFTPKQIKMAFTRLPNVYAIKAAVTKQGHPYRQLQARRGSSL